MEEVGLHTHRMCVAVFIDQTHARGDALHTENTQRSKSNKVEIYDINELGTIGIIPPPPLSFYQ